MHNISGAQKGDHTVVYEDQLPDGKEWAFITVSGSLFLVISRAHWGPGLLAQALAEYAAA